jgi:hypothetical protein
MRNAQHNIHWQISYTSNFIFILKEMEKGNKQQIRQINIYTQRN